MRAVERSFGNLLLGAYKGVVSPIINAAVGGMGACRFQPTCSEYAAIAFSTRGVFRGSLLSVWRLLRCNPLFAGGFDPVPGTYADASSSNVSTRPCHSFASALMRTSAPPVNIEKSGGSAELHLVSAVQPQPHDHQ